MLRSVHWSERYASARSLGFVTLLCISAQEGQAAASVCLALQQDDDDDDGRYEKCVGFLLDTQCPGWGSHKAVQESPNLVPSVVAPLPGVFSLSS